MLPSLTWSLLRGGACHRTLTLHQRSSPFSPPGPHLLPGYQTLTKLKELQSNTSITRSCDFTSQW